MPRHKAMLTIPTVHAALDLLTVDQLKQLIALLPTKERPTRKGDAVALVEQHLSGERLRALWEQLDATQKLAVAETIYADESAFNPTRFFEPYTVHCRSSAPRRSAGDIARTFLCCACFCTERIVTATAPG